MKIKLGKNELQYLYDLARARHDAKHKSFRNASQIMPEHKRVEFRDTFDIEKEYMPHFLGLVGEYAWSQHSGEPLDETIYAVRDPGEDFKGVEVKTVTYFGAGEPELKIKVEEYEEKTPETYVLARFSMKSREVEVLGTITRHDFEKCKVKKKYGRNLPTNFIVPVSKMRKV